MKLRRSLTSITGFGLVLFSAASLAATTNKVEPGNNAGAKQPDAVTNAVPATIEIAASKFNIPTTAAEGRDPFFPTSSRLQAVATKPSDNSPKTPAIALQLKGISGYGKDRVALINTKTFRVGDVDTIMKIQIRCVSIGDDSVTVEVQGVRKELRLPQGF